MKQRVEYLEKQPEYRLFSLPDGTQDLIVFSFIEEGKDEDENIVYIYDTNQMHGHFEEEHVSSNLNYYLDYEQDTPKSQIARIIALEEISNQQDLALAEIMDITLANSEALADSINALIGTMEV